MYFNFIEYALRFQHEVKTVTLVFDGNGVEEYISRQNHIYVIPWTFKLFLRKWIRKIQENIDTYACSLRF